MNAPAVGVVLVGAVLIAVAGCSGPAPEQPQATAAWVATASAAPSGGSADDPVIGVAYPFRLFTHCGIRWTEFAGRTWTATTPRPEPATVPDPTTGMGSYDGYAEGTMTLLAPDRARFDIAAPRSLPGGVEFTPTDETPPLCA